MKNKQRVKQEFLHLPITPVGRPWRYFEHEDLGLDQEHTLVGFRVSLHGHCFSHTPDWAVTPWYTRPALKIVLSRRAVPTSLTRVRFDNSLTRTTAHHDSDSFSLALALVFSFSLPLKSPSRSSSRTH